MDERFASDSSLINAHLGPDNTLMAVSEQPVDLVGRIDRLQPSEAMCCVVVSCIPLSCSIVSLLPAIEFQRCDGAASGMQKVAHSCFDLQCWPWHRYQASLALPVPFHRVGELQVCNAPRARRPPATRRYKAYFRWSHYQFKLQPGLVLPEETEACASVTSAFLQVWVVTVCGVACGLWRTRSNFVSNADQVLNTLFFVETRRIENPRNILQLLSMNTRRTKVVELSSGTHRCAHVLVGPMSQRPLSSSGPNALKFRHHINTPTAYSMHSRVPDELKRHSLSDGGAGSYSTNLDRNRYGNDDQYLSTVIRYDLEFLVGDRTGDILS
jgi:hypothetical protein